MREDDEFGHYLPLLRRIIILVAVITAVPVALWTITAFVRTYVGPPKLPTFHQLAAKASINEPLDIKPPQTAVEQANLADPPANNSGGDASAPKGPLLAARLPDNDTNATASTAAAAPAIGPASQTASVATAITPVANMPVQTQMASAATAAKPADPWPLNPMAPKAADMPAQAPAVDAATPAMTVAAQPPAADDAAPAAAPLAGPIPLPRRRPRVMADAQTEATPTAQSAPMTRVAAVTATGHVPIPRPRPEAAGPAAPPPDASSGGPLGFLSNIFSGSK